MGSIGFAEIAVIAVIALLILGPDRLPGAARQVGKALAQLRGMTAGVKRDFEEAIEGTEIRSALDEIRGTVDELNPRRVVNEALSTSGTSTFTMASGSVVDVSTTNGVSTVVDRDAASQAAALIPPPDADIARPAEPGPTAESGGSAVPPADPFLKAFPPIPRKEDAPAPPLPGSGFHDVLLDDD